MDVKIEDGERVPDQDVLSSQGLSAETEIVENIIVELKDSSVFRLGECFDSYEELLNRLATHSKQSMIHYWRRDSRTVQGAYMKTARPIQAKLVYYSVKYACVYGGQKFFPRGKGQRHSISMRTDCPGHIMVRANKQGSQLEVISVCNTHNHPISKELYRRLPQDRRLSPGVKQEVLDLLRIGVHRKQIREYVRTSTGQLLTNKDLLNLGASDRRPRTSPRPARAQALLLALSQIKAGAAESAEKDPDADLTQDSTDSQGSGAEGGPAEPSEPWGPLHHHKELIDNDTDMDIVEFPLYDSASDAVGREVIIYEEEHPQDSKNIIEYLYPGDVNSIPTMADDHDIIISASGDHYIQQSPDGNENTLFQGFSDSTRDSVGDTEINLPNVLVIEDALSDGGMCSVPIRMLKLGTDGCISLKDEPNEPISESITLEDAQGIVAFTVNGQNIIVDNLQDSVCIDDLEMQNSKAEDVPERLSICDACGRTAREIEEHIAKLREEQGRILRETAMLMLKREKLRNEIKDDRNASWRTDKSTERSAKAPRGWDSLAVVADSDVSKIEYIMGP